MTITHTLPPVIEDRRVASRVTHELEDEINVLLDELKGAQYKAVSLVDPDDAICHLEEAEVAFQRVCRMTRLLAEYQAQGAPGGDADDL